MTEIPWEFCSVNDENVNHSLKGECYTMNDGVADPPFLKL